MGKSRDQLLLVLFAAPLFLVLGLLLIVVGQSLPVAQAANVLAVLPSVWKSHYIFGRRLLQQLASQTQLNYSVTLISPHADEFANVAHIREIRVDGLLENWHEMGLSFNVEHMRQKSVMERFTRLIYAGTTNVDLMLADRQVRKLLRSGERFDLLVVDLFLSDSLLGLAHYYRIPTVVISPTGANTWLNQMLGNPQSSALDPSNFLPYSERMNVWQRVVNTLMSLFEKLTYNFFHMISQQTVYEKHFQSLCQVTNTDTASTSTLPHHRELTKNLSLVLVNSHPIIQYPRAYLPNMLEIAGAHLHAPDQLQLPNSLRDFIEAAPNGVIYMSLGANMRTIDMAREKLDAFVDAFSYFTDMHILLKWEQTEFNFDLPPNVMLNDWFPQEAVLAHPNVKVFISTCGLMSIVEAISGTTPLLAIPIQPEQEVAAERMQTQGVALSISYDAIAYDSVLYGIQQLTKNHSYYERMQQLRVLLQFDYGTPIAKSLHYIELILQTNGADFYKSHATHLNFLRSELLDVLVIIALGALVILAVPFFVICFILRKSYNSYVTTQTGAGGGVGGGVGGGGGASYHISLKTRDGARNSCADVSAADIATGVQRRRGSNSVSSTSGSSTSSSSSAACSTPPSTNPSTPTTPAATIGAKQKRASFARQDTHSSQLSD